MKINLRKPKFIIPLILLPFILLFYYIFYSWGGTTTKNVAAADSLASGQLNPNMPGVSAEVKDAELKDKFGAYLEAYKHNKDASALDNIDNTGQGITGGELGSAYSADDLKRMQARQKMDSLQRELQAGQQDIDRQMARIYSNTRRGSQPKTQGNDQPLTPEQLLQNFNHQSAKSLSQEKDIPRDRYNEQISLFRDQMSIMDSMQQAYTARSEQGQGGAATSESARLNSKSLTNNFDPQRFDPERDSTFKPLAVKRAFNQASGFNTVAAAHPDREIKAMIDQEVKASAGSRVRIRLLNEIYVGEYLIPKGTYLYGIVTGFQTQRVNVSINQILLDNVPLPVKLDVFDTDGYLGLYVPGSTFREFTKEIGTQGTQGLSQVRTSDNSNITTGLVNQLFQSTSTSASKLIRKEKALLKYNYIVYLKERK